MVDYRKAALDFLARLGACPVTSFREGTVAAAAQKILTELGVEYRLDRYGNIIARCPGTASVQPPIQPLIQPSGHPPDQPNAAAPTLEVSAPPPIAFMAHLDHPGFEAIDVQDGFLVAKAMGGVPPAAFDPGVPLLVLDSLGRRLEAATAGSLGEGAERRALIALKEPDRLAELTLPLSVVFDLTDFALEGDFIRMRSVDDLAGCGSILTLLSLLSDADEDPPAADVYGVFTRAEEVGLVGARLLAEAGTLPPDTLVVSLESSRTLPGAEIGGGPVIRVGDAGFTFNAAAESALIRARETLQARPEGFKAQRQLMSGGVCEASAFALYGYRATGIAFPLGNYHNGAPEGRIEAEFIHQDDYLGGIELMLTAVRCLPERENTAFRRRLGQIPDEFRRRLLSD